MTTERDKIAQIINDTIFESYGYNISDPYEAADAILAALPDMIAPLVWQPIETAPKDGSLILAWYVTETNRHAVFCTNLRLAQWIVDADTWRVDGVGGNVKPELSHWMPMPAPPTITP
jgi:hypothetical protein